jgi:hypothetical protein
MIPNEDMLIKQQICKALLITLLHRTYKESGYTNFVGLFGLGNINYKDKIYYGLYLVSHHSKYIGALKTNIRYLINNGHSQEERDKQIDSILNELKQLMIDWTLNININYIGVYHPLEFIYQSDLHSIKIGPPEIRSENPTKYVKNVRTTSEILTFFSSTFHHSGITCWDDLECINTHYPLKKFCCDLLDGNEITDDKILVNVDDCEEYDYINKGVDIELHKYS